MRLAFAFVLALAACGGPTICVTTTCENSARTYQACGEQGSTVVEDRFGNQSCSCDTSNTLTPDCMSCQQKLKAFCAM